MNQLILLLACLVSCVNDIKSTQIDKIKEIIINKQHKLALIPQITGIMMGYYKYG